MGERRNDMGRRNEDLRRFHTNATQKFIQKFYVGRIDISAMKAIPPCRSVQIKKQSNLDRTSLIAQDLQNDPSI